MDTRILRAFLEVAQLENITRAAAHLHITQPALSRQLKALEQELGVRLFTRLNYSVKLTEEGMLLRKRAREILDLEEKTLSEFSQKDKITGCIYIGSGESSSFQFISDAYQQLLSRHPDVHFHIYSGDETDVSAALDAGLIDFGVFIGSSNVNKYNSLRLPCEDVFGLIMRKDAPLAAKSGVSPEDIRTIPLFLSRQTKAQNELGPWLGYPQDELNIIGAHNLTYNVALMVRHGICYALTLDGIIPNIVDDQVCFRPFDPPIIGHHHLVWKKNAVLSKAACAFLDSVNEICKSTSSL